MKTEVISKGQFCRARQIVVNFAGPFNPIPDISMAAPMINHHKTTKKTDFHAISSFWKAMLTAYLHLY